jgi:hypothetical protein
MVCKHQKAKDDDELCSKGWTLPVVLNDVFFQPVIFFSVFLVICFDFVCVASFSSVPTTAEPAQQNLEKGKDWLTGAQTIAHV